jgi:YbgC/YbaW family acyl-CoA thioester hydrolase
MQTNISIQDFIGRVFTSDERVQFSQVDPYGHLNSSRYCEFVVNHRIVALADQLKFDTLDIMKLQGVAFVVSRLDIRYLLPSFLGEKLEIASWIDSIHKSGFEVRVLICGEDKKIRAATVMEVRTVDAKTGKPVRCPETLPTRGEASLLTERPTSESYLSGIAGSVPFGSK